MTLRHRLLAAIGVVATVLVLVSVLVTSTTRDELIDQVDQRLGRFTAERDWERLPGGLPERPPPAPNGADQRISDIYEGYVDADGELITLFLPNVGTSADTPPDIAPGDLPGSGVALFTTGATDGGVTYRVSALRTGDVVRITAVPLDDVEATIDRLLLVEVLGSLAILAALGLVGWWIVRLGIRPVKEMTETATRIAEGEFHERVPEGAPGTESGDLAIALNRMLGHIGDALEERAASEARLRRFVADASHELRTPVTTIRGYAELYRHGGLADSEALDDAMRRTEQEAARMGRLVEDMLTLAKLDRERELDRSAVDLLAVVTDAVGDLRAVDPTRPVTLTVEPPDTASAVVAGDEDRLRQVLANVLGNTLVHTEPGTAVDVALAVDTDLVRVAVHDHGPGMPSDLAERATERFVRADPARTRHRGGSGLGLSIVDAVLQAHGGSVRLDSTPGNGTTVTMEIPVGTALDTSASAATLPR